MADVKFLIGLKTLFSNAYVRIAALKIILKVLLVLNVEVGKRIPKPRQRLWSSEKSLCLQGVSLNNQFASVSSEQVTHTSLKSVSENMLAWPGQMHYAPC